MKPRFSIVLMLACVLGFGFGLFWLFQLRFAHGDVYPPYSSLRADPLGTMALYESLGRLPGVMVQRDYSVEGRLPDEARGTTYLHLAGDPFDWSEMPRETVNEIERFVTQGGRLVVAFAPEVRASTPSVRTWTVPPAVVPGNTNKPTVVTMTNTPPRLRRTLKEIKRERDDREYVNLESRWGFTVGSTSLHVDEDGVAQDIRVENRSEVDLPMTLAWHSANYFQGYDGSWRTVYERGTNAVLMAKPFGAGSLVLVTDSYFASNEALAREPHATLLAWLIAPGKRVVFDEAHLGVAEDPGVTTLMWRYHLQGLIAGAILLLALFVWKNSVSLIPFRPPPRVARNEIIGKDSGTGFVNLLRRHVKPSEILRICFDEWTKSLRQRTNYTVSGVDRAQTVMEREVAQPTRLRNSVQAYNEMARALNSRNLRPTTQAETLTATSPVSIEPTKT